MNASSRRKFLQVTSALAATGYFSSRTALGRQQRDQLGVALVGLGSLSTNQIAPALQKTKHIKLAGIVTGTPSKVDVWRQKYGIPQENVYNYETYDQIANNDAIDLVYIVLPNSMHAEYTIRGAKAGKHVFCEKPMANSAADCKQMIEACEQNKRMLGIGYRCQFEPHHQHCMKLARDETFGKIRGIEANFGFKIGDPKQWRLRKDLAGGGPLMDVGIYALQACRYLTGGEPIRVTATETKTDPVKFAEVEESLSWTMEMPHGIIASCSTTYNFNGMNNFRAFGDDGYFGLDPAYSYEGIKGTSSRGPIEFPQVDHFAAELDDFAQCIREGRATRVPGEEGLKDLLVIEAIYAAARTGTRVAVQSV